MSSAFACLKVAIKVTTAVIQVIEGSLATPIGDNGQTRRLISPVGGKLMGSSFCALMILLILPITATRAQQLENWSAVEITSFSSARREARTLERIEELEKTFFDRVSDKELSELMRSPDATLRVVSAWEHCWRWSRVDDDVSAREKMCWFLGFLSATLEYTLPENMTKGVLTSIKSVDPTNHEFDLDQVMDATDAAEIEVTLANGRVLGMCPRAAGQGWLEFHKNNERRWLTNLSVASSQVMYHFNPKCIYSLEPVAGGSRMMFCGLAQTTFFVYDIDINSGRINYLLHFRFSNDSVLR